MKSEISVTSCSRHVWLLAHFHPLSGSMTHQCRRCGKERTSRALHMHHGQLDLYDRWGVETKERMRSEEK